MYMYIYICIYPHISLYILKIRRPQSACQNLPSLQHVLAQAQATRYIRCIFIHDFSHVSMGGVQPRTLYFHETICFTLVSALPRPPTSLFQQRGGSTLGSHRICYSTMFNKIVVKRMVSCTIDLKCCPNQCKTYDFVEMLCFFLISTTNS